MARSSNDHLRHSFLGYFYSSHCVISKGKGIVIAYGTRLRDIKNKGMLLSRTLFESTRILCKGTGDH